MSLRPKLFLLIFFLPALIFVFFNNCSADHNWISFGNGSVVAGNPMSMEAKKISAAVCQVITQCNASAAESDCENGVAQAGGMALALGVAPWGYDTLQSIEQAEAGGLLTGQASSADSCASQITATNCSSSAARSAYNASSPHPYSGASHLVTGSSCGASFVPSGASSTCPSNYVLIPPLIGYTNQNFCVSKFEMKENSNVPTASPSGAPWTLISRNQSITACRTLGTNFDLISNAEWQTTARNVANQSVNWSSGIAYSGQLNTGYSQDGSGIPKAASPDDNQSCFGTSDTCSSTQWSLQRRTHVLSNGSLIWDLAGNAWEWVSDDYNGASGVNDYVTNFTGSWQTQFGNSQNCPSGTCGFGAGNINSPAGAIARGETYGGNDGAGIFAVDLRNYGDYLNSIITFRCVYRPPQ